ncbi:MAG TPA: metal ABC transporter permease [Acidimicrobiales bacterium]|nr:metal ABC transporter permease [Acidimicrobiales bacterium]
MPYPFEHEYMQLALLAGLVVGACAPLIGIFIVQKRMSLLGDGIGHLAFAGVAGGLLLGIWPVWSALAVSVFGAVAVERLRARGRATGDLALALFFYGGIAGGVVLIGLSGSLDASLFSYLFGSILTVRPAEVWVVVGLGAVIVLTVAVCGRALFAMAVDEEWATVAGLPVAALNAVLSILIAVTIVASMRVVGILLVAALMVLPVASAQVVARSQLGIMAWSVAIGVASVVVGLVSARVWGLAPGGSIVLVTVALFAVLAGIDAARRTAASRAGSRALLGRDETPEHHGHDHHGHSHDPVLNDSQSAW